MTAKTPHRPRYETLKCSACGQSTLVLDYLCPACKCRQQRAAYGGRLLRELPVVSPVKRTLPEERG